ncbi:MAG TPA: hypothetical protein VGA21_10230 [Cyclobacteriaceae bacterium]
MVCQGTDHGGGSGGGSQVINGLDGGRPWKGNGLHGGRPRRGRWGN